MKQTKTPEQMAEDWVLGRWYAVHDPTISGESKVAFLAGYKAGQEHPFQFQTKMWVDPIGPQDRWISVKEQLPEDYVGWTTVYGCILSRWGVQPGFYTKDSGIWISRFVEEDEGSQNYVKFESVTHWMPLPEPPKE